MGHQHGISCARSSCRRRFWADFVSLTGFVPISTVYVDSLQELCSCNLKWNIGPSGKPGTIGGHFIFTGEHTWKVEKGNLIKMVEIFNT